MSEKNPWLAAILNLFIPGIGFTYVGVGTSNALVIGGLAYLFVTNVLVLFIVPQLMDVMFSPQAIIYGFLESGMLAIVAYGVAEIYNEKEYAMRKIRYYASNVRKFCNYCGAENPADAVFCRECGREIR